MTKCVLIYARPLLVAFLLLLVVVCTRGQTADQGSAISLTEARRGFITHLLIKRKTSDPVPQPPAGFQLIRYASSLGLFPAYLTLPHHRQGKHPAIIWLAGGFDNSIDATPWTSATPDNDQSARAFRQAGIMTMYPSLRGGNNNPGDIEGLYGEVDDVLAAAKYLAGRPDVDPHRIYLGGHSTGGTLALLVAESTGRFRAIFAFGPVSSVGQYGVDNLPFDYKDRRELLLRAPILYMDAIHSPTFVFEGTIQPSNIVPLEKLCSYCRNPGVHFFELPGLNHFSELAPITPVIAGRIVNDTGQESHFSFLSDRPQIVPVPR